MSASLGARGVVFLWRWGFSLHREQVASPFGVPSLLVQSVLSPSSSILESLALLFLCVVDVATDYAAQLT